MQDSLLLFVECLVAIVVGLDQPAAAAAAIARTVDLG
jgi:hypothetical protein